MTSTDRRCWWGTYTGQDEDDNGTTERKNKKRINKERGFLLTLSCQKVRVKSYCILEKEALSVLWPVRKFDVASFLPPNLLSTSGSQLHVSRDVFSVKKPIICSVADPYLLEGG